MGLYTIIIEGCGSHHNEPNIEADANRMVQQFIGEMQSRGHTITYASLAFGQRQDLLAGGYCDMRERKWDKEGKFTCLGPDQLELLKKDGRQWTNGNFGNLMRTVEILYAQLESIKNRTRSIADHVPVPQASHALPADK